jgi:hypothetical protein
VSFVDEGEEKEKRKQKTEEEKKSNALLQGKNGILINSSKRSCV